MIVSVSVMGVGVWGMGWWGVLGCAWWWVWESRGFLGSQN